MNKDEFIKMIKDEILEYMPEEFKDCTVRIDEVNKSGDVRLHGLALTKGNSGASPLIYLEPYFEMYEDGLAADFLLQNIADKYVGIVESVPNLDFIINIHPDRNSD